MNTKTSVKEGNFLANNLFTIICFLVAVILYMLTCFPLIAGIEIVNNLLTILSTVALTLGINALYFSISKKIFIENIPSIGNIIEEKEFYKMLQKAREIVAKKVRDDDKKRIIYLTNFSKDILKVEKEQVDYFNAEITYCKNNPNVTIKRIITIRSDGKFNYFKKMVDSVVKDATIQNLHIAYLNTNFLHYLKSEPNDLKIIIPKLIGSQIHDDEVIIMNPMSARIEATKKDVTLNTDKHIFIKNKDIAEIFENYHNILWDKIDNINDPEKIGCILYDWDTGNNVPTNIGTDVWAKIQTQAVNEIDW